MAVVLGVSSGFVITAPTADPAGAVNTTIDGSSVVTKDTAPKGATITITEIGWYRGAGTNAANFEIALYSESAGIASTRVQVDATNSSTSGGWTVVTGLSWAVTENTAYWLAVQMDAHSGSSTIDGEASGGAGVDVLTSQTTLNNPYGGGTVSDADGLYAIYAKISIVQNLAPAVGAATWEGFAPTVVGGSGSPVNVTPSVGAMVATGFAPIVAASNEYQVLLDRATTLTYGHPTAGQKIKQNTLFSRIKSAGLLDDIEAMWIFATDSNSDFATLNWITPASYQCTKVNSPVHTLNQGFNGNDSNSYLNTNLATNQLVKATVSSVSFLIDIKYWPLTNGFQIGSGSDSISFSLYNTVAKLIGGDSNFDMGETPPVGTWFADRSGTDVNIYNSNSLYKNVTTATGTAHEYPIWIDAMNEGAGSNYNDALIRVLIIAKHLDSTKRTALYDAVTAYINSITEAFPNVGAGTFNGFAPTVSVTTNQNITTDVGAGTLIGFAPTVETPLNITADLGVATFVGFEPTVTAGSGLTILPDVGVGILTGFGPTVVATDHKNITADLGVGLFAGFAPVVFASDHKNIITDIGAATYNGFVPTITTPINLNAGVGVLTATGFAPSVATPREVSPGIGVCIYNGFAPTLVLPRNITVDLGVALYNGFAPSVAAGSGVLPDVGSILATGFAPTVSVTNHINITLDVGAATYTGFAPTVFASDSKNILIGLGEATLNGFEPTVFASDNKNIAIGLGEMVMVGYNPAIGTQPTTVFPDIGAAIFLGYEPTVVASTTPVNVPEPKRMRVIYLD